MLVLVTGGSGSGKSEFAENMTVSLGGNCTYIACMKPFGAEARQRIERHREMRGGKGFTTVERYTDVKNLDITGTALLECMSNLLANEMFSGSGENAVQEILDGVDALMKKCDNIVIVTNEVSSDGITHDGETEKYKKNLGALNCFLALKANEVYEVSCGIGRRIKKEDKSCIY